MSTIRIGEPVADAEALLNRFPAARLARLAGDWHYDSGELPDHQGRSSLTKEELIELGKWKMDLRGEMKDRVVIKYLRENNPDRIATVTRAAFAALQNAPDVPSVPAAVLSTLEGVGMPLATTILASVFPGEFGILDRWAWRALKDAPDGARCPTFDARHVDHYELVLRIVSRQGLSEGVALSPRDIDKALWTSRRPSA
jgi:hypothetical protein